eukprot:6794566-Prymnesium_polylepis.1
MFELVSAACEIYDLPKRQAREFARIIGIKDHQKQNFPRAMDPDDEGHIFVGGIWGHRGHSWVTGGRGGHRGSRRSQPQPVSQRLVNLAPWSGLEGSQGGHKGCGSQEGHTGVTGISVRGHRGGHRATKERGHSFEGSQGSGRRLNTLEWLE